MLLIIAALIVLVTLIQLAGDGAVRLLSRRERGAG